MNRHFKITAPQLKAVSLESANRSKIFSVECSVCNKDKELYPNNFTSTKTALYQGCKPCGCSSSAKLTDAQDILVVNRCLRNVGSSLTAKEVSNRNKLSSRNFILTCKLCSQDEGLWPYGSIKSTKGGIKCGRIPCGCSAKTVMKRWQYELRIRRRCQSMGYIFHGLVEPYENIRSKVRLENPITGNKWKTTNINDFLRGYGDPKENKCGFNPSKPASIYINKFFSTYEPVTLKYGITNRQTIVRLSEQERVSKLKGRSIFEYHSEDGGIIEKIERELDKVIALERVDREVMPDGFTEAVYYKPFIEKFIINYIEMLTKRIGI